jgi:hypothetical protein
MSGKDFTGNGGTDERRAFKETIVLFGRLP